MSEACLLDWYSPCESCGKCRQKCNRDKDQVCCTNCNNLELSDDDIPDCIHKDKCCLENYKDSMNFEDRQYYEE